MFKVFDFDDDGFVNKQDIKQLLQIIVGKDLKESQLQEIIDLLMLSADKDKDGKLNYEEFKSVIFKIYYNKINLDFETGWKWQYMSYRRNDLIS